MARQFTNMPIYDDIARTQMFRRIFNLKTTSRLSYLGRRAGRGIR